MPGMGDIDVEVLPDGAALAARAADLVAERLAAAVAARGLRRVPLGATLREQ